MTQTIEGHIQAVLTEAFTRAGLDPALAVVTPSDRPEMAQYQCNGAFAGAKALKKAPLAVAEEVAARVTSADLQVQAAAPGFININLSDAFLARWLDQAAADARLGCPMQAQPRKVIIDFGGPNVAKNMHVGHLRSSLIGDALQRIARFAGDQVASDVHLGDWGTQMGMLIEAVRRESPELPYFDETFMGPYPAESPVSVEQLNQLYPAAAALCKEDDTAREAARRATAELQAGRPGYRALWRHFVEVSVAALREDFGALDIHFDLWKGESDVQARIPGMIEDLSARGIAVTSEGALVIPVDDEGEQPPLILLKSDGAALYGTTDLATLAERVDEGAETVLYVVDKRQALHFKQVFCATRRARLLERTEVEHVAFGTMNGTDGKPFKTRAGGVMKLNELIDMLVQAARAKFQPSDALTPEETERAIRLVALATIRFADLSNHRLTDYVFDLGKFSQFEGRTGPYILYSAVRINSIIRKAEGAGVAPAAGLHAAAGPERNLMLALMRFPDAVEQAYRRRAPNVLCDYVYNVAQAFSRFYNDCPIIAEPDAELRAARLRLAMVCLRHLDKALELLGMTVPERM